jgi:hypothetical protein
MSKEKMKELGAPGFLIGSISFDRLRLMAT